MLNDTCPSLLDTLGFLKFPEIPNINVDNTAQPKLDELNALIQPYSEMQSDSVNSEEFTVPKYEIESEPATENLEQVSSSVLNSESDDIAIPPIEAQSEIESEPEISETSSKTVDIALPPSEVPSETIDIALSPSEPETSEAPSEPETSEAPSEPETSEAPSEPETSEAPSEPETSEPDIALPPSEELKTSELLKTELDDKQTGQGRKRKPSKSKKSSAPKRKSRKSKKSSAPKRKSRKSKKSSAPKRKSRKSKKSSAPKRKSKKSKYRKG
jgi:hypothetical protein